MTGTNRRTESTFVVWIYEDTARGVALLRGRAVPDVLGIAGITSARWSTSGKGHVVPIAAVSDVAAACEYAGVIHRTKAVTT